jgi:hypothetical protein
MTLAAVRQNTLMKELVPLDRTILPALRLLRFCESDIPGRVTGHSELGLFFLRQTPKSDLVIDGLISSPRLQYRKLAAMTEKDPLEQPSRKQSI